MSSIASAALVPLIALGRLREAAQPKSRFFGPPRDAFPELIRDVGEALPDYDGQGFVLATLLAYLQDQQINLLTSDHSQLAEYLARERHATFVVLTEQHRAAALARLDPAAYDAAVLERYYEEFVEHSAPGAGVAMLEGVAFLRATLAAVKPGTVALVTIA
jgi:hypothetical protein